MQFKTFLYGDVVKLAKAQGRTSNAAHALAAALRFDRMESSEYHSCGGSIWPLLPLDAKENNMTNEEIYKRIDKLCHVPSKGDVKDEK